MKCIVETPKRGWYVKPNVAWDSNPEFEFIIEGHADCGHAKDLDSRKSASEYVMFLCGTPVSVERGQQNLVVTSVTEDEKSSVTVYSQDMLCVMRIVEHVKLRVKKPMKLTLDNK